MTKRLSEQEKEKRKSQLLLVMTQCVGRSNAVSEAALYERVFGERCLDHDAARPLRGLINELRRDGVAICSSSASNAGGYWLASAGSELENYCRRLRARALKVLRTEAKIRKVSMGELFGQIQLDLKQSA